MIGANLVMLAVLGQTPPAGPANLVERLGSARYAEREEAADALERLGRQALPALRRPTTTATPRSGRGRRRWSPGSRTPCSPSRRSWRSTSTTGL